MSDVFPSLTVEELTAARQGAMKIGPFGSQLRKEEMVERGVKVYGQENVIADDWTLGDRRISSSKYSALSSCELEPGDVVVSMMGTAGKCAVFPATAERGIMDSHLLRVQPNLDLIEREYFATALQTENIIGRQVAAMSHGSIMAGLSSKIVKEFRIPVPPLVEQPRIVEVLGAIDTAIRETEALIDKLKAVKQGLLHDLLTRGIDANGQLRPPQSEAPQLYKESPLGWIPREWEIQRLDAVAARGSGHTPSKDVPSYWNGGIKWVSLADSHRLDRIYIQETDKEVSELGIANSSAVLHSEGTVILSRDAGIGKSAILGCDMAVSQHFMAWRCGEKLNNLFLYFYLQREKPKFEAIAMGSTIKTIGLPFFKSYEVAVPPRREQDQAAAILMETEQDLAAHDAELEKLRQQKIGLMDDLLTGRVRVTPLLEGAAAP